MWPTFGSISMTEVIITSILYGFDKKNLFLERCSWLKFNNLELGLGVALKFYTSVAKRLKLQIKKVLGLIPTFVEVTGENLFGSIFLPPPS